MMRQDPKRLYANYGASSDGKAWDGRPMPAWDQLGPAVQAHWTVAALAASGLELSRIDAGFKRMADSLIERDRERAAFMTVPASVAPLYWQLRTWGRMAAADWATRMAALGCKPGVRVDLDVGADGLALAFGRLAGLGVDCLLGALEQDGERPVASALMHSIGALAVAGFGLGATAGPASLERVVLAFERIADCHDLLEHEGEPRREGKMWRAAAWNIRAQLVQVPRSA